MPNKCIVYQCNEPSGFRFPKDKIRRKWWIAAVRRDKWRPTAHSIVCLAAGHAESGNLDFYRVLET